MATSALARLLARKFMRKDDVEYYPERVARMEERVLPEDVDKYANFADAVLSSKRRPSGRQYYDVLEDLKQPIALSELRDFANRHAPLSALQRGTPRHGTEPSVPYIELPPEQEGTRWVDKQGLGMFTTGILDPEDAALEGDILPGTVRRNLNRLYATPRGVSDRPYEAEIDMSISMTPEGKFINRHPQLDNWRVKTKAPTYLTMDMVHDGDVPEISSPVLQYLERLRSR